MYIYKININNFRNIRNLEWKPNKGINILVGGNGIGKSNIAIAIDYLLNPYIQWYNRKMSEFDYYNRELDKPVEIEVWFKDVEEFIEDDWELYLEHVNEEDEITTDDNCELTLRLKLYAAEDQIPHHVILTNDKEYPLRTSQKGFINYIYISANREPLKELSLSNGSLLNSILEKDIMDEKVKELMDSFNMKSRELFSDTNEGIFSTLSKSVKEFGLANEESAITIEPTELSDRKTLQTFSLVCKNNELTNYIPLKYQSDGIKNIMLLLALNKQIRSSEVLFIEEIEQNLEPAMQRKIIKKLTSETNKQLFITTHSTDILKIFKLEDILYFNKDGIKLLPQIDSNIDKYYRRAAEYRVLSSLFSKAVLLVEGDAELGGIPIISKAYGDFLDDNYISLISCQGKENIIRFAKFFDYLSIKNVAMYDNDTDIDETLSEYKNSNLNTLVLVVTRDYENGIVKIPLFKTHWKEILTSKHEFETNKYINNLFIEKKASDKLKLILSGKEKAIKGIKSIEEIEGVLSDTELTEYLHDFLHRHMASISGSEYVMEYLYDLTQDKLEKVVPKDYVNIFKLISIYMGNNACGKNCILKPNTENICTNCADYRNGYLECFQIKE